MKTKTWIAGLASATLLATVGFVAAGTTSNALQIGPVGTPVAVGAGTITWKTTTSGRTLVTTVTSTASTAVQTLSETGKCVLSGATGPYLTFTATGPAPVTPGFTTNSLGVNSNKESTGTSCRQVNSTTNPAETLTIKLNPPTATGAGVVGTPAVTNAALDLNLSGNAIVRAELKRGETTVGRAQLLSGRTLTPPADTDAAWQLQICNDDSNSGPQSKFANNCYWKINALTKANFGGYVGPKTSPAAGDLTWDTIALTLVQGDFSIQGGNAYPITYEGSAGTVFTTASFSDGQIDCPVVNADGSINYSGARASATGDDDAVITRLALGDAAKACVKKPYSFSDTANTTTYRYPSVADQATSQYAMKLPRDYTAAEAALIPRLPESIANWEDGSLDVTLRTCVPGLIKTIGTDPYKIPTVDYSKITTKKADGTFVYDQSDKTVGLQYACIYSQEYNINTSPNTQVGSARSFDYIYFTGDLKIRGGA